YKLQHILVTVPEEASPEQTARLKQKVEGLLQRVRGGEQFGKVAAAESDGQNALEGGELGWFKPGELPAPVLAEVEAVQPGHLSRVVRTPSGFHIFKVTDRRQLEAAKETQVKARHILLRTDSGRSPQQAMALAAELKRRIRNGADFAKLARQFSEGPSAKKGGDLGWVSRGQMVPAFDELIFSLEPGQVGGPVRTQFGVHIAEVTDKRTKAIDPADERKQARQALRTRKTRERMDQWQRELRAQAYVQIRLDKKK
ncbi:MAG TPA: peptidylprolyl isomerase, partial [Gammaproteobacteria bacterium]|nr:peptidylprolyl isomerase [Gammaproteobacteria bacterium]